jgi:Phosphotransferase system mannitol/fructose-specific IIA domain (Ntr-type)
MNDAAELIRMIQTGGVYYNISGANPAAVFADAVGQLVLPPGVDPKLLCCGLCEREGLMTTSIGNGIAIPHPRTPLVSSNADERIYVCFLDKAVSFDAMDGKLVYVLFIILSSGSRSHLKALSGLSYLFQQDSFRKVLQEKPTTEELVTAIKRHF